MILQIGNLTVEEFIKRVDGDATTEEIDLLESYRTDKATFTNQTQFHIFDNPGISIVIGSDCLGRTGSLWKKINSRKTFNREVNFYPAITEGLLTMDEGDQP